MDRIILSRQMALWSAYAQKIARDQNRAFEMSLETLGRRLAEQRVIVRSESEGKNFPKRSIEGLNKRVMVLSDPFCLLTADSDGDSPDSLISHLRPTRDDLRANRPDLLENGRIN